MLNCQSLRFLQLCCSGNVGAYKVVQVFRPCTIEMAGKGLLLIVVPNWLIHALVLASSLPDMNLKYTWYFFHDLHFTLSLQKILLNLKDNFHLSFLTSVSHLSSMLEVTVFSPFIFTAWNFYGLISTAWNINAVANKK